MFYEFPQHKYFCKILIFHFFSLGVFTFPDVIYLKLNFLDSFSSIYVLLSLESASTIKKCKLAIFLKFFNPTQAFVMLVIRVQHRPDKLTFSILSRSLNFLSTKVVLVGVNCPYIILGELGEWRIGVIHDFCPQERAGKGLKGNIYPLLVSSLVEGSRRWLT